MGRTHWAPMRVSSSLHELNASSPNPSRASHHQASQSRRTREEPNRSGEQLAALNLDVPNLDGSHLDLQD